MPSTSDSLGYVSRLLSPQPTLARLHAQLSLAEFFSQAWETLEPATPLAWGEHIDAVCDHLEALLKGEILNLYVAVPPGTTKSILANVCFPAWCWTTNPSLRFLCAANEGGLATRDAVSCRRLLESDWYRANWGHVFRLTSDQNVKTWYENNRRGFRTSITVGSKTTGRKGDILIVDDPHDTREVESEAKRRAVLDWWDQAFFNRVNNPKTGRRLIIGQRTHVNDLAAHVLAKGGFEALVIPEEYDPEDAITTSIGWKDWRTEPGELLRKDRFGTEQVVEAKRTLGSVGYAAQHQQKPVPREGALFKAEWLDRNVFHVEKNRYVVRGQHYPNYDCIHFACCDPAGGDTRHADYTACGIFAVTPKNDLLLVHVSRVRFPVEKIVPHLAQVCEGWDVAFLCVEDSFLQKQLIVKPAREKAGLPPVRAVNPGGKDKYARSLPAVIAMEAGQILVKAGAPWMDDFRVELLRFTGKNDEHDDQCDVLFYGVQEWKKLDAREEALPAATQGYRHPASGRTAGGGKGGGYRRDW